MMIVTTTACTSSARHRGGRHMPRVAEPTVCTAEGIATDDGDQHGVRAELLYSSEHCDGVGSGEHHSEHHPSVPAKVPAHSIHALRSTLENASTSDWPFTSRMSVHTSFRRSAWYSRCTGKVSWISLASPASTHGAFHATRHQHNCLSGPNRPWCLAYGPAAVRWRAQFLSKSSCTSIWSEKRTTSQERKTGSAIQPPCNAAGSQAARIASNNVTLPSDPRTSTNLKVSSEKARATRRVATPAILTRTRNKPQINK